MHLFLNMKRSQLMSMVSLQHLCLQAADIAAAENALVLYRGCVRKLLARHRGYECQESDGNFMLALHKAEDAIFFAILVPTFDESGARRQQGADGVSCVVQVQEAMLDVQWDTSVLALPHCQPVFGSSCQILFAGPRVRIGMYEDKPTRVVPHVTSGRADVFGAVVNRAARYCHAAAHGGQIAAPLPLVTSVLQLWTGVRLAELKVCFDCVESVLPVCCN